MSRAKSGWSVDRRELLALGAGAAALPQLAWAVEAAPPPNPATLDDLMRKPVVLDAALSPDGKRVAVLRESREGDKRMSYLLLADADALAKPVRVAVGDVDVQQVEWASNDRLLIWILIDKAEDGKPTGLWYYGEFVEIPVRRVLAIDADGGNGVVLFNNEKKFLRRDFDLGKVVDMTPGDPGGVIMQIWNYGYDGWVLHRVDVRTGVATELERGTRSTLYWYLQDGVPVLRFDSSAGGRAVTVFARAPGETEWKKYRKFRRDDLKKLADFDVLAATDEPGVLLVGAQTEADDTTTVRRFDVKTLTMGEIVAQQPGRDIEEVFCDEKWGLVASRFVEDRDNYRFSDPQLAAHYKGMNAYFGNQCNVRLYDVDETHNRFITRVSGPRQPDAFYLYDKAAKQFASLGESRPWLKDRLANMEPLKVKARDGLELTAYLTTPVSAAAGPRPMVVMPHGGPQLRDSLTYDLWAQALAAQGWLVLQPNFRGSGGYGKAFAKAGHRHWGDAMQWDVEDCVAGLVASGKADPKRLAILGASYGGYAAMMGPLLKPGLYRCAISRAGPCDLLQDLADTRADDGPDSPGYRWWVDLMGDPKTDEAMLKAASPKLRANEFAIPLLLFHGTEDTIVDVEASRGMNRAMKKAGKPCDYVEVKGEGHSGWSDANERKFLERSIAHIAKGFA